MAYRRTHHEPASVVRYRRRVGPGKIMRPSTFEDIVERSMVRYGIPRTPAGFARARRIAGAAYWTSAEARARGRRRAGHRASR